ncbi:putative Ig domain-containing protein, partial [Prosthecobacter sp.]|uniref:beta strand repeat-containing protein n=1 Tax=Prosthecobacter sp. TaxID=1965333 RepID=UPI00248830BE
MGLPTGYSSPSNVSKEAGDSTVVIRRAAAWVLGRCARGQRSLTAGITLFVASAVAALAATDFSDYNLFGSASSTTVSTIRIGALTDSETSITANASATGDDNTGSDDEDGVTLPVSLVTGTTGSMVVRVTNASGSTVYLNAWIDFNNNGVLTNTGEQIATNTTITNGTSNANRTINFSVPSGASIGDVGVRVRLTSTSSPGSTGQSGNGEVEDYLVQICPTITVGPTSLSSATVGTPYSQTISASGGSSPYSFSVSSGSLPDGLTLSSGGALSGTPTSGDSQTFTVQAVDQNGCVGTRTYTFTPTCTSYVISPFAMGSWDLSTAVNVTLVATATSGSVNAPLTWSRSSGTLPAGLSLSSAGVLSGTTTAKGTSSFTLRVTDSYGCTAEQPYLMTVASGTSYSSLLYVSTGNGSTGYLETYDVSTGAKKLVGQTRDSSSHYLTDLAWSPSGILYGIDFNNIYQINPTTGAVTRLGSFSTSNSFNGLVFDSAGTPYMSSVSNGDIYTFNISSLSTNSNTSTSIAFTAPATVPNGQALNSAGDLAWIGNELYYTTAGSGFTAFYLYKVPEGGNAAQLVGQVKNTGGSAIADVFGLSTDGYGTLFAQAGNALYTLDKTTGVATTITSSMASSAISGGAMRYEFTQVLDDFGDYSGFDVARNTVFDSLFMGSLVDYDIPAAFNMAANADDLSWTDDEDGVTLPASAVQGATGVSVTVKVTNTSGAPAFLNGWIDFDNNGSLTESGEQIINNVVIPSDTNNVSQSYTFNVPANAAVGSLGARFRLTAVTNPSPSGASGPGEVEDYLFNVTCSTITLTPTTLPAPTVGTAYSRTVAATGGNAPYSYAVATGALPAGLTLNATTGVISGTVTSSSATSFTLRATDAKGCTGTRALSVTPICPAVSVTPASLNTPTVGTSFSQTLSAAGGISPYTWALTSGSLPAGLSLSTSNGTISGLPTSGTAATFSARATDAAGCTKTQSYTVTPDCPTISISPGTLTAGSVGTAYSQTLSASGGTAAYSSWTVTSGSLPSGLTLNASTGIISGTPTASASPSTSVTVRVNDAYGCQGTQVVTLQICPVISVTPSILPTPTVGTAYSQNLSASGGTASYTYTLASGTLPTWATLSSAGLLSGTPTSATAASFAVRATDANGCSATVSYTVTPVCPTITITPATLVSGTVGSFYSQTLSATGGVAPYSSWTVTAGTLPAGLTLNASTGVIGGTPTASASPSTSVTVRVNDANGCQGTRAITLQICPVITFSPTTLSTPTVGTSYSQTITASGGTAPYTFTLASGTLPAWASLTSAGVLSGTPNTTTTAIFTLRVTDANACTTTLACTLTPQCPTITLTPSALAAGTVGTAYSQTLAASGGIAPYSTWTVTGGALPAGLTLNASTGVISGTPTASASPATTITFRVNDANGCQGSRAITLKICPAITLAPTTPAAGTVGVAYSQTISASGGAASYTFAVVSGTLPVGLSLNASTGVVSGTPTSQTSGNVTLRATDANGCQGTQSMTFAMGCPAITISTATLPLGTVGSAYSQTLAATGGSSTYTWTVTSGTLPAGLSLSSGGVLSGTPTTGNAAGVSVTISATDSVNTCAGTKTYTLQICPVVTLSPTALNPPTVGTAYSQTVTAASG